MASGVLARSTGSPWTARWIERSGFEPLWVGVAAGVLLAGLPIAIEGAAGHVSDVLAGRKEWIVLRAPVVSMFLIGLTPALHIYLTRWTRRHVELIAPLVEGGVPDALPSARPSRTVGIAMAAVLVALFVLPQANAAALWTGTARNLHELYEWFVVGGVGWLTGRFVAAIVGDALLVSDLAARLRRVDLLDPAAFAPFVQQGLRGALLVLVILIITAVIAISPEEMVLASAVMMASVLTAALLAPVRGVRLRIRREKDRQLRTLRVQIDAQRRAVLEGQPDAAELARLPGLLALESRLEAVREWPFDTSSLTRFGLYLLIGLGSWIGAATVERLIDWGIR